MRVDGHHGARTDPAFDELRRSVEHAMPEHDPAHAPGKRRIGRPADQAIPRPVRAERRRHQPWIPTSGFVGRTRRSARRS